MNLKQFLKKDMWEKTVFLGLALIYFLIFIFIPFIMLGEFVRYLPFFIFFLLHSHFTTRLFTEEKRPAKAALLTMLMMLPAIIYYGIGPTDELCRVYLENKIMGVASNFAPRFIDIIYYLTSTSITALYLTHWFIEGFKYANKILRALYALILWTSTTIALFFLFNLALLWIYF